MSVCIVGAGALDSPSPRLSTPSAQCAHRAPFRLAVPGKRCGLTLLLAFSERCGNSGFASSATGSAKPEFPRRGRQGRAIRESPLRGTGEARRAGKALRAAEGVGPYGEMSVRGRVSAGVSTGVSAGVSTGVSAGASAAAFLRARFCGRALRKRGDFATIRGKAKRRRPPESPLSRVAGKYRK